MSPFGERSDPSLEEKLQARLMEIEKAFETAPEQGVDKLSEVINELTHSENSDPELAAQIAETIAGKEYEVPPELQNRFETKIGEALLYGGNIENERFEKSTEYYDGVRQRAAKKIPENINDIPENERPPELSEHFHATDRLADLAFLSGSYEDAASAYHATVESRGKFKEQEQEIGPVACAKYGEAASAFMQGDTQTCLDLIAEAKGMLAEIEDSEPTLYPNIEKLEVAAEAFDELAETEKTNRLEAIKETLKNLGGKQGGVKRVNFQELFDEAGPAEPNSEA